VSGHQKRTICIHLTALLSWKKALREIQTLRAGCSKAEPKISAPPQTPLPGTQYGQNLISWRWLLPLPTNLVWWWSMHAISSYRGNRHINTQTKKQDRLQYTAPLSLACSVNITVTPLPAHFPPLITIHHSITRFPVQIIHLLVNNLFPCFPGPSHCLAPSASKLTHFSPAPCGLWGCKNRPTLFPGRMSYKATKPGSVCPVS